MTDNPQPPDLNTMPRFAGVATFMRLPVETDFAKLDIAMAGKGDRIDAIPLRHGHDLIQESVNLLLVGIGIVRELPQRDGDQPAEKAQHDKANDKGGQDRHGIWQVQIAALKRNQGTEP
jgi:hypothetical protein